MDEKELFVSLTIIGFALGLVGFSTIIGGTPTGNVVFDNAVTHNMCISGTCVEINGEGNSECAMDDHCYHLECVRQQCTLIDEPGADFCFDNRDCAY